MREISLNNKNKTDDIISHISNTIFATIFSALITEVVFNEATSEYNLKTIVFLIFIFIISYSASYIIYNKLFNNIIASYTNMKVHIMDTSADMMRKIQKNFDNIACDSILVSLNYIDAFSALPNTDANKNLKTFYFYEIIHYLDTACEKTNALVKHREDCIRTTKTASGVDIFRVSNLLNIIIEIDQFLDDNFDNICDASPHIQAIEHQRFLIKEKINYIQNNI